MNWLYMLSDMHGTRVTVGLNMWMNYHPLNNIYIYIYNPKLIGNEKSDLLYYIIART